MNFLTLKIFSKNLNNNNKYKMRKNIQICINFKKRLMFKILQYNNKVNNSLFNKPSLHYYKKKCKNYKNLRKK